MEAYDTFTGMHTDFGFQAWGVSSSVTGTFSTYTDEKVIERVDVYADVARHSNGIDEGSYSCTLFTYGGVTKIATYYPPTGFTASSYYMPPSKSLLFGCYKSINDAASKTVSMKIKNNYSFWTTSVSPLNSWNGTMEVLY